VVGLLHAAVERHHDTDVVALRAEGAGEGRGDVAETSGLGETSHFRRDEQDVHGGAR
jgi:hypothetical protein